MADSVGIVRSVYEAFARGDVQTVLGLMSEKVEWNEAEHFTYWPGSAFIGPQAVGRLVGCGDTVLSEGRYRGTVKATGKRLDVQVAHVWDVR